MARQSIQVNPGLKEFEAYMDFSGGVNTETSNERLKDNEFTQMVNVDLSSRGSVKKRTGYSTLQTIVLPSDNPQGMFFFYRKDRDNPDIIFAVNGNLYVRKNGQANVTLINIDGMSSFDENILVEGVQYYNKLYVATGKNIVVVEVINELTSLYSAKVIEPYEPNSNELKYIGTNSLLGFGMSDTVNNAFTNVNQFSVKGLTFKEFGTGKTLINAETKTRFLVNAYVNHNPAISASYYKAYTFYYKKSGITDTKETKSYSVVNGVIDTETQVEHDTTILYLPDGCSYDPNTNSIDVFDKNGHPIITGVGFTETDGTKITLTTPASSGDKYTLKWIPSWYSKNSKYGSYTYNFSSKEYVPTSPLTTTFNLPTGSSYVVGTNSVRVFVNGVELEKGTGFVETNSTIVTTTIPTDVGDKVVVKWIDSSVFGSNQFVFRPLETGYYDFKVVVNFGIVGTNNVHTDEFIYQGVQAKAFKEDGDILEQQVAGAKKCNRIRLYWDRLMLFGDPDEPTQMYFSDIGNPAYFPQANTLRFDTGRQEPITAIVRLHDYLIVFSRTLIHTLTGKTKDEFTINLINDSIGCIAERSAVLTGNVVTFLSNEGVFQLRPSTFKLDQLNVQRLDEKIKSQIKKSENACALNYDSQYWLCYPDDSVIYRYYYERGVWVKDVSEKLNFVQFLQEGNNIFAISNDVKLYQNNPEVYTDGGLSYDMIVESKYFDLSKSFNFKKLKRLYVLGAGYDDYDAEYKVSVFTDSTISLDPESGYTYIDPVTNFTTWVTVGPTPPNVEFHQSTKLGTSDWIMGDDILGGQYIDVQKARIRGKCQRVKVKFVNSQTELVELFGFGLEFKLKKP